MRGPSVCAPCTRVPRASTGSGSVSALFPCPRAPCPRVCEAVPAPASSPGVGAAPCGRSARVDEAPPTFLVAPAHEPRMTMRVTALSGGTGGAKLLRGLAAHLSAADLTVIGNTGDDAEIWGLHVSPDLDSVTYALAGCLDPARGWGLRDETFRCLDAMGRLGGDTWFRL